MTLLVLPDTAQFEMRQRAQGCGSWAASPASGLSPRARLRRDRPGGRTARRLVNLGVYLAGTAVSTMVGPLIYALGERDSTLRWAVDLFGSLAGQ